MAPKKPPEGKTKNSTPVTVDEFREQILNTYEDLSKRLKQVADYVLNHPNDLALESLVVIAERSHTQPSTFIRFAKAFGFSGASQMQKIFRKELYSSEYVPSYEERIRQFKEGPQNHNPDSPTSLLDEFADSTVIAIQHMRQNISQTDLNHAIELIAECKSVFSIGMRRSFPVASYINYALHRLHKPSHLISGAGGMLMEETSQISNKDLLIAISFHPCAKETEEVVALAKDNGASVLVISDNVISSLARKADVFLEVKDASLRHFRSLSATMCLAQTLVIGYAYQAELTQESF